MKVFRIIYCVDNDTQEAIEEFDNLDAARDEQYNRSQEVAVFETKKAAEVYLKQMDEAYELCKQTGNTFALYDIFNPAACKIEEHEIYVINEKEAKEMFDECINDFKAELNQKDS